MDQPSRSLLGALVRKLGFSLPLCSALPLGSVLALGSPLAHADGLQLEPTKVEIGAPARAGSSASSCVASSPRYSEIDVSSCTTPQGRAFVLALRIELAGVRPAVHLRVAGAARAGAQPGVTWAVEECGLEAGRVVVIDANGERARDEASATNSARLSAEPAPSMAPASSAVGSSSWRVIELSDVAPVARPTTAAIAVAEIVRTQPPAAAACPSSVESSHERSAAPGPAGATSAVPAREATEREESGTATLLGNPERPRRPRVGAGAWVTVYNEEQTLLLGASALGDLPLSGPVRLAVGASYARASTRTPYGTSRLSWTGASAGPDLVMSLVPELRFGARVGIAQVRAQGESVFGASERALSNIVVLGSGCVDVQVPVARRWWLRGGMEVGAPLLGARFAAGGYPSLSIWGLFLGWHAGVLFSL